MIAASLVSGGLDPFLVDTQVLCVCARVCVSAHACGSVCGCLHMCVGVYVGVCTCLCAHAYVRVYVSECMSTYLYREKGRERGVLVCVSAHVCMDVVCVFGCLGVGISACVCVSA